MRALIFLAFVSLLSTTGCMRQPRGARAGAPTAQRPDAQAMRARIEALERELSARESAVTDASLGQADRDRKIDELSQLNAEMSERLKLSSEGVQQLAAERARLTDELSQARAKLGEDALGAIPAAGGMPGDGAPGAAPVTAPEAAAAPAVPPLPPPTVAAAPTAPAAAGAPAVPAAPASDDEVAAAPEP